MSHDPVCSGLMFSDMVIREQGTGKLSLIGVFSQFNAPGFPFTAPPFYVTAFLTNFQGKVESIELTIRVEESKSAHVLGSVHGTVNISPDAPPFEKHVVIEFPVQIPPARFPEQGIYFVVVLIDGNEVNRRSINIRSVTGK